MYRFVGFVFEKLMFGCSFLLYFDGIVEFPLGNINHVATESFYGTLNTEEGIIYLVQSFLDTSWNNAEVDFLAREGATLNSKINTFKIGNLSWEDLKKG